MRNRRRHSLFDIHFILPLPGLRLPDLALTYVLNILPRLPLILQAAIRSCGPLWAKQLSGASQPAPLEGVAPICSLPLEYASAD
jgi:hypothetical protein